MILLQRLLLAPVLAPLKGVQVYVGLFFDFLRGMLKLIEVILTGGMYSGDLEE
jgi:hypothetical protein